jgi:hypothetical protein
MGMVEWGMVEWWNGGMGNGGTVEWKSDSSGHLQWAFCQAI